MHGKDFEISIENLSKIEGHADLDVKVKGNKVTDVKLRISENKRFFTQAARGKMATAVSQIVSRICGTCSIAHETACIEAVEHGLKVTPSEQTLALRKLLLYGLNIRDHAMHLYLFCLPDVYGKDSILEFPDDGPLHELVHKAFDVKSVGNELSTEVGGRAVHAPFPAVGGFTKIPNMDNLKRIANELEAIRDAAVEFVEIFHAAPFVHETDSAFVALINEDYSFLGNELASTEGMCVPEFIFNEYLNKTVIPYSQAPGFKFKGKQYTVGAISRMNLNGNRLHRRTRKTLSKYLKVFPSKNLFHNNLAQAIEIVHCIDHSLEMIENLELEDEKPIVPQKPTEEVEGVGVIEAPRGTLYYNLKIGTDLKIRSANLVIPTSQNQIGMERELGRLVQDGLDSGKDKDVLHRDMENLIRAYDPCMSCATHFLKVNWAKE
jgi:coenzyme F420-reducing hydrogenase alpha subunit